ncbi:MAG: hypothetical protein FWC87_05085 [Acidimicrobiaceae bacterium]|nr:hypothetical protein [Acidimicrobiaceae bacterium]
MDGQLFGQLLGPTSQAFPGGTPAPVVRISPRSGRVIARSEVLPVGLLVAGDGAVWLAAAPDPTGQAAGQVYVLDPSTLKVRQQIPMPRGPAATVPYSPPSGNPSIAIADDGAVWAGTGTEVVRIDPRTGATSTPVTFPALVGSLAVGGGRLYDTYSNADGAGVVEERDATTGRLLASQLLDSAAGPLLEAAAGTAGVWASWRGGMVGTTQLLAAAGLRVQPAPKGSRLPWLATRNPSTDVYTQTMGTSVSTSAGVLWLIGDSTVSCADPGTGVVHATEPNPTDFPLSVAAIGSHLYASGVSDRLLEITPPAAC